MSVDVEKLEEMMTASQKAMDAIESYTCVIHCQERIKGKLRKPESIFSRCKKPKSVYLRWQPGPYQGLQSSYVPERDGARKFKARLPGLKGLAGAMSLPHDSPLVEKTYPHHWLTHETNLVFLLDLSEEIMKKAMKLGKFEILESEEVTDRFIKRPATRVLSKLSANKADGLKWLKTEFFFDHETQLPLHFKLYDFDGEITGEYAFTDFKANVSLSERDFELNKL